jgi:hypothetical protein
MDKPKIIVRCANCTKQNRIPSDKHIRFTCPHCGAKAEYASGVRVDLWWRIRQNKSKILLAVLLLGLSLLLFEIAVLLTSRRPAQYSYRESAANESYSMPSDTAQNSTASLGAVAFKPLKIPKSPEEISDSIFEEKVKDFIQEKLEEELLALLEDINHQAENGNWETANAWYEKTTQAMSKSQRKRHEAQLAKLKVKIISKKPTDVAAENESSEPETENRELGGSTVLSVKNNTPYTLTLYYAGPTNRIVSVPAFNALSVTITKGSYKVVARVDAPKVHEYVATEIYAKSEQQETYFIESSSL